MANYSGFSTDNWINNRSLNLSGIELVKRDLLTHIFTVKGERLMMPDFGTRIPTLVFEPNDEETLSIIREDLQEVFTYDPRVDLLDLNVFSLPDNNTIVALADLFYVELDIRDELRIEIAPQ